MYKKLLEINRRPQPFQYYTVSDLWTDPYRAEQMLNYHLNEDLDISSRNHPFINRSVEWIFDHFGLDSASRVADFGCGPGLYASRLARKGASVTGIDFSPSSIAFAKGVAEREGLSIDYLTQNYLEFDRGHESFDLIIMIFCDFCALSPEQRLRLLKIFDASLNEGGSVLLDVCSLAAFGKKKEGCAYERNQLNHFWSPNDYFVFINNFVYHEEKVSLDKYTIFEEKRSYEVYNWLQYFSPESLEKEAESAGFAVKQVLGDVAGAEYAPLRDEFAVILEKKVLSPSDF